MSTVVVLMAFHMFGKDSDGESAESIMNCRNKVKIGMVRVWVVVWL